jgi:hypothetical protein
MALDSLERRLVVFGRYPQRTQSVDSTWVLDLNTNPPAWAVGVIGALPAGRFGALTAFDSVEREIVMAGGWFAAPTGGMLRDTWVLPLPEGAFGPWREPAVEGLRKPIGTPDYPVGNGEWKLVAGDPFRWRYGGGAPGPRPPANPTGRIDDPSSGRRFEFTLDSLWTRTPGDPDTWTVQAIAGTPPETRSSFAQVGFDVARVRILAGGGSFHEFQVPGTQTRTDRWALSVGGAPAWTLLTSNDPPAAILYSALVDDPTRDRFVRFGGCEQRGLFPCEAQGGLYSTDRATGSSSLVIATGMEPSARYLHLSVRDRIRNRLLVLGGIQFGTSVFQELWSADLGASSPVAWEAIALQGAPLPETFPYEGLYDVDLDAIVLVSNSVAYTIHIDESAPVISVDCPDTTAWSAGNVLQVTFGLTNARTQPATFDWSVESDRAWPGFPWVGNQLVGAQATLSLPFGIAVPDTAAFGTSSLRFIVADASNPTIADTCSFVLVDPAFDVSPIVSVGGDVVWSPGAIVPYPYEITNRDDAPHDLTLTLDSERAWPGFPSVRVESFAAKETRTIQWPVSVPDSVAPGANLFRLTASWNDRPEVTGSGTQHVHDATTPVAWALVRAIAAPRSATIEWWIADRAAGHARIERRVGDGPWAPIGDAIVGGDGRVVFADATVEPGGRYGYRAGAEAAEGEVVWSDVAWVDVPDGALRVRVAGANPVRGALRLAYELRSTAGARVEVYDLAGRRVAARSLSSAISVGEFSIAGRAELAPGLYLIRLTQGGESAVTRAIVLP